MVGAGRIVKCLGRFLVLKNGVDTRLFEAVWHQCVFLCEWFAGCWPVDDIFVHTHIDVCVCVCVCVCVWKYFPSDCWAVDW